MHRQILMTQLLVYLVGLSCDSISLRRCLLRHRRLFDEDFKSSSLFRVPFRTATIEARRNFAAHSFTL